MKIREGYQIKQSSTLNLNHNINTIPIKSTISTNLKITKLSYFSILHILKIFENYKELDIGTVENNSGGSIRC